MRRLRLRVGGDQTSLNNHVCVPSLPQRLGQTLSCDLPVGAPVEVEQQDLHTRILPEGEHLSDTPPQRSGGGFWPWLAVFTRTRRSGREPCRWEHVGDRVEHFVAVVLGEVGVELFDPGGKVSEVRGAEGSPSVRWRRQVVAEPVSEKPRHGAAGEAAVLSGVGGVESVGVAVEEFSADLLVGHPRLVSTQGDAACAHEGGEVEAVVEESRPLVEGERPWLGCAGAAFDGL